MIMNSDVPDILERDSISKGQDWGEGKEETPSECCTYIVVAQIIDRLPLAGEQA
jgi:hypothetical protein